MTTSKAGGFGQEFYGDPMGGGGPLHVIRARAIGSHVVRIVFNETPLNRSAAGKHDFQNPSNYTISVVEGTITSPSVGSVGSMVVVGVDKALITGPVIAVSAGEERGADVHTDKPFVLGMRYRIQAANIQSRIGGILGAPTSAEFQGIYQRTKVSLRAGGRMQTSGAFTGLIDIKSVVGTGTFDVDDSGDLAPESDSISSLRKRLFRRLVTPRGAFAWLPNYGCGLVIKDTASIGNLHQLKQDITEQFGREPEVQQADVTLRLDPLGILYVMSSISTVKGAIVGFTARRDLNGIVT